MTKFFLFVDYFCVFKFGFLFADEEGRGLATESLGVWHKVAVMYVMEPSSQCPGGTGMYNEKISGHSVTFTILKKK
jgi:hypothetical protein